MSLHLAVCGAGAFGRNHVRIYRELEAAGAPIRLAAIVDPALTTGLAPSPQGERVAQPSVPQSDPARVFASTEELLAAVARKELCIDAASVCTPTSTHHAVAAQLLRAGIDVLVEKPIAGTLAEAENLIALARTHQCTLQVGHLERFNPAVQAVQSLLRGPMFFEAHRLSVFSPRSLDVDVVLDLMVHDLDIVLHLAQSAVLNVQAVGLPILSPKTDIANVRVEFTSGAVANFTASRVSTERVRKLRFFQPHEYVSIDYARQDLLVIEVQPASGSGAVTNAFTDTGANTQAARLDAEMQDQNTRPALPSLGMTKPPVTPGEPLRLEIESFLRAVRENTPPEVTGEQARDALALALQIQAAIEAHARHAGLQAFTKH